jgi:hypothetical protein
MEFTELKGPYLLTAERLRIMGLTTRALPGVYALGHTDEEGTFIVESVGRSDENLREKLQDHAGRYKNFAFEFCHSAKDAFEKECDLCHNFMVEMDFVHPNRLLGSYWKCPHCNVSD